MIDNNSGLETNSTPETRPDDAPVILAGPIVPPESIRPLLPFTVVGVGASAGGLEAFTEFFQETPVDTGMAFVVIQHLPPERESLLTEILSKHTAMPVQEVTDGMKVEPNRVYVICPGRTMTLTNGTLHLGTPLEKRGHQRPVDDFFRSLAMEQRERAIAIVMSGMGSNGSAGAQTVKAVGGICIAQDPETAKFPSMPRNLIEAGHADFVLRVEEMPGVLLRYGNHPYPQGWIVDVDESHAERLLLREIIGVLRARTRVDFSGYKKPTLLRRIQRRMSIHQVVTTADYARLLRQSPAEVIALSEDLMIHVTGFFRDPESWEALRKKVIVPLVAERPSDSALRAWVTACASGEEAYTLAIMLIEAAEAAGKTFELKIFATDTAERSLAGARTGVFPGGIESEVSPARLERFFDRIEANYRIKKAVRDVVVFAPQNILRDPPFSRLDICTCRNLLIYLEPGVQHQALSMIHFGLLPGGALLLGTSETVAGMEDSFEIVDKKHRIFRRIGSPRPDDFDLPTRPSRPAPLELVAAKPLGLARASFSQLAQRALVENFSPPAVVIDRQLRVVYFHGRTDRYLEHPRGEPTRELMLLAREFVRGAVRQAVHRAMGEDIPVRVSAGAGDAAGSAQRLEIGVTPLEFKKPPSHFLVTFEEGGASSPPSPELPPTAADREHLARELHRTQFELRRTVEELQASNEELKAANEEATSVNEELQSINEELETNKEELQSLNEELTTVNAQLETKMHELEVTTNDLSSLLSSTNIAVLFLDTTFCIRRYTPAVKDLIDLIPSDLGRPLNDLARKFSDPNLLRDAQVALDQLVQRENEVTSESGHVYLRRAMPCRTIDHRINGVVIAFFDIGARRIAENKLHRTETRQELILEAIHEYAIFLLDPEGRIATWPTGAERVFGFTAAEAVGQTLALLLPPDGVADDLATSFARARESGSRAEDCWLVRKDGTHFWGSGMLYPLKEDGKISGYIRVLRDNTDHKRAEENLIEAKRAAEEANAAKDQFLANVSHELRTPLSAIMLWIKLLKSEGIPPHMVEGLETIDKCAGEQQMLIEDIVDTSRIATGKLRLELKPTDLSRMVRSAVDAIRPAALAKLISVTADYGQDIGLVSADAHRLHQVVWNLLTNAAKFTPAGGRVTVRLRREKDLIEIVVADSGQGITAELLPRIFERFRQAENITTRSHSGLGLGLSIARQLVELHGGTLTATSEGINRGSTFTVSLPLTPLDPTGAPSSDSNSPLGESPHLGGLHVLFVEDSPEPRKAISALLSKAGATVTAVGGAAEALEELKKSRPHVIVSDLGLPEMDGHALIRRVRELEKAGTLPEVPAIALTAYADDANRSKAISSGFARVFTKPVDTSRLLHALEKYKSAK